MASVRSWFGALLACAPVAMGCGGSDESSASPEPQAPTLAFDTEAYSLQPGEEKYICYTMRLPADHETIVTGVAPRYGQAAHHIVFAQTMSGADEPEGASECNVLFKDTWMPLWVGGKDSSGLTLPEGVGFNLAAGQQLLIQMHLQNTSDQPITDTSGIVMTLAGDGQPRIPAGIYGLDDRKIDLPPHSQDVPTEMTCRIKKDMNVFAGFAHMHKLGKTLSISQFEPSPERELYATEWSFDQQPTVPLSLTMHPDDRVRLGCTFDNPSDVTVNHGESSDDEMCVFVFYYYPYDQLDGCIGL